MASQPVLNPTNKTEQISTIPVSATVDRTIHVHKIGSRVRITPEARRYAIAELSRRANVPETWRRRWNISIEENQTVIDLQDGSGTRIEFPHAAPDLLQQLTAGHMDCVRRGWMSDARESQKSLIPDFIVPFAKDADSFGQPLFRLQDDRTLVCTVDLPLSVLLTLSRWEETFGASFDLHGRFSAESGIAKKGGFLHRPVVDEYGIAFEEALRALCPSLPRSARKLSVKFSHDADHIGIPFRLKNTIRHITHHRQPLNSARDLFGLVSRTAPSDLQAIREIVSLSLERELDSAVYWKASLPSARDSGYDPRHRKVKVLLRWLEEKNVESGVHPGYDTFQSPEKLRREVTILREVLGSGPLGGRQHYLRWCPDTWIHWEMCGLAYDSTLSFADHIGFRAGTCWPYRPWIFSLNREADILEIPLIAMDRTLLGYMGLSPDKSVEAVMDCIERCRQVGGLFTLLWHNNNLLDPLYCSLYLRLLPLCWGGAKYDWRADYSRITEGAH